MFFKVHILYIEEGPAVYGWSDEEKLQHRDLITSACIRYQLPYTVIPFEMVFDISRDMRNILVTPEEINGPTYKKLAENLPINKYVEAADLAKRRQHLQKLLQALTAPFAADLCFYLKKWLISDFCLTFNFKRVLLATTGHKIATQLIGALAKGRGASIYSEVAFSDDKNFGGRVCFCNPMKEFL